SRDWSSDVCSSDLLQLLIAGADPLLLVIQILVCAQIQITELLLDLAQLALAIQQHRGPGSVVQRADLAEQGGQLLQGLELLTQAVTLHLQLVQLLLLGPQVAFAGTGTEY